MARVYRRQLANGLRIYVNNRLTQVVDPTYSMASSRHTSIEGLNVKTSRLVVAKTINVPLMMRPRRPRRSCKDIRASY